MGNTLVIVGIVVGVAAMGGAIMYGTENQKSWVPEDAILQSQADEGLLQKTGALGADLNKEQWYEDPYAQKAAEIREKFESGQ